MRLPFTNNQLAKIATFGAVFVGGNAVLMHYLVNKRFHESEYFVNAASLVLSHSALVKYLGEPVRFGNPNLSDNALNYSTQSRAQFDVPIKGSKTTGNMRFAAERTTGENDSADKPIWHVTSLEVTVDDRPSEKVVIVRSGS